MRMMTLLLLLLFCTAINAEEAAPESGGDLPGWAGFLIAVGCVVTCVCIMMCCGKKR
jgi:hypothetical protein